jgi:hypothetical protein
MLRLCFLIAQAVLILFFLELEKEKGIKRLLKPLSILKPKMVPKITIPAPPIIALSVAVDWTLLTLTERPNASLALQRWIMGYQVLAGKA